MCIYHISIFQRFLIGVHAFTWRLNYDTVLTVVNMISAYVRAQLEVSNRIYSWQIWLECTYLNTYLKESWERKAGSLVWNSKYSTSPESPLSPMSLKPYRNGWLTGLTDVFSWTGLAKKLMDSCSILEMVVWSTPWLTTLKNPRVSQALTICIDTRDLSCDMSIIGMSWSTATIFWDPFTIFRERERERYFIREDDNEELVCVCMCWYIYMRTRERIWRPKICYHVHVLGTNGLTLLLVESYKYIG